MWLALRLFFSGVFEHLLKAGLAVLDWLLSDWRNGPLTLLATLLAILTFFTIPAIETDRDTALADRDIALGEREETMDAYRQTVANYIAAAKRAQANAQANVARVEAEQAQINKETIDDYEARLAGVRAAAERLRERAVRSAFSDPSGSGRPNLSGPGSAASGIDEAPGDPQFPAGIGGERGACPAAFVCLTIDEARIATEQAIQLDALIDWSECQSAVPFTQGNEP